MNPMRPMSSAKALKDFVYGPRFATKIALLAALLGCDETDSLSAASFFGNSEVILRVADGAMTDAIAECRLDSFLEFVARLGHEQGRDAGQLRAHLLLKI